ncbi:arginase [Candidatus Parvarchaeota archaeon]|nr:arginase [Candidatus Parvarchaeota archaeon]
MAGIDLLGVPSCLGANREGCEKGPKAVREAGLLDKNNVPYIDIRDLGDIEVPQESSKDKNPKNIDAIKALCLRIRKSVKDSLSSNRLPLVIGGDHSLSIGTLAGVSDYLSEQVGLIWFDAHPDFNTPETSITGNMHGMSLAVACGLAKKWFAPPEWPSEAVDLSRVVIIGARSFDEEEAKILHDLDIRVFTIQDIDLVGIKDIIKNAIDIASGPLGKPIHVSFDMDVIDPLISPGVSTPVDGGITFREARLAMELLHDSTTLTSAEFVETNPLFDYKGSTINTERSLITSLFGKRAY